MSFNDCVLFQYDYLLVVHEEAGPFSFTVYANFTVYSRKLKLGRSLTDARSPIHFSDSSSLVYTKDSSQAAHRKYLENI